MIPDLGISEGEAAPKRVPRSLQLHRKGRVLALANPQSLPSPAPRQKQQGAGHPTSISILFDEFLPVGLRDAFPQ